MAIDTDMRQRVMAALAVLRDGRDAAALCDYMSDEDRVRYSQLIDLYSANDPKEMQQIISQSIAYEQFSSLAEIHPAWILEKLCEETPRVIGICLRYLPSRHVHYILKNMPPMLRIQIPNIVESFAVRPEVLDVIQRRFERNFLPIRLSRNIERLGFEDFYYFRGEELALIIREVGLVELAIALAGLSGKILHTVFNRLGLKDAKRLQRTIREMGEVSPELFRQARYTVLEMKGQRQGVDKTLTEIGLAALASSIEEEHGQLVRLLQQRLEPSLGYLFKRLIDERLTRFNPAIATERRRLIIDIVASMSREARIDPSWCRLLKDDEPPIALEAPEPTPSDDEVTLTGRELAELA